MSALVLVAALLSLAVCSGVSWGAGEGIVRFVKSTGPSFDRFTDSTDPAVRTWIVQHMWRMQVYSSYFDDKTSWYHGGWFYQDLYALYTDDGLATQHPDWVLRDANGNPLYIPWGCSNGTCPQYAGDPGNPAFRQWWIDQAAQRLAHGYKGIWIDDVNLEMRVSNGDGTSTAPIDPRTGATMTDAAWRHYVADFVEQIRQAFPSAEIVHNALWFAAPDRTGDPDVRREIQAADYINLERSVNDGGLTGGSGQWSLRAFLSYIDAVHSLGRSVVLDGSDATPVGREYSLAAYYLTTNGTDGLGCSPMTPDNWWAAYDANLGDAIGARYEWDNVIRRDYANGIVLLNPPGSPTRTITLPTPLLSTDNQPTTTVTLEPATGAVLHTPQGVTLPQGATAPPQGATARAPAPSPRPSRDQVRVRLQIRRQAHGARARRVHAARAPLSRVWDVLVRGRVQHAAGGRIRLRVERRVGSTWRLAGVRTFRVTTRTGFSARLDRLRVGQYRLVAVYAHAGGARTTLVAQRRFVLTR